jgi:STE24 endopeptidase
MRNHAISPLPIVIALLLSGRALAAPPSPSTFSISAADAEAGDAAPTLTIPEGAQAGPGFDVDRATQAWVDTLSPEQRARSDAYFEGGYVLQLVGFVYGLGVAALFLLTPLSWRLRAMASRVAKGAFPRSVIYAAQYVALVTLFTFPLSFYEGFHREHAYGMANNSFGSWLGDEGKSLGISLVLGSLFVGVLYLIFRKAPRTWWVWGTVAFLAFAAFGAMIGPVYLAPMFNTYKSVPEGPMRQQILSLARANGIPADDVYWFDASRQTKRISANVSGLLGTTRISLNDNLMNRSPEESIQAVLGHEMGHYVLNHVYKMLLAIGVIALCGFAFTAFVFDRFVLRWGSKLGISGISDPAGLPLLAAIVSVWFFLMTPMTNSLVRTQEVEADIFGLNASRQPDGFANTAMQLSEYRKIHPGKWEEIVFFDHPSGWNRVRMSMTWKKENADGSRNP